VKDFRVCGCCSLLLSDILGLVLVGVLADCDDFSEIYDYGTQNIAFLRYLLCRVCCYSLYFEQKKYTLLCILES
jgi:hypothetical protein